LDSAGLDSWLRDQKRVPLVMGVLNVTPDSFSDGGQFAAPEDVAAAALAMQASGAAILDIGGESSRPGAMPVAAEEQIRRVVPAISAIRRKSAIAISIDTTQWPVAAAALGAGADVVNDISAGRDDGQMLPMAAKRGVPIILMHMRGTPRTMQESPVYQDVTGEIGAFLTERMNAAIQAGIAGHRILIDPGIGFGKTTEHDLTILRELRELTRIGPPLVVGVSRKKFIGRILDQPDTANRLHGTAAAVAWAVANGAAVVRVHDVGPISEVVRMVCAIGG
jgi:dihydropteroate synthase